MIQTEYVREGKKNSVPQHVYTVSKLEVGDGSTVTGLPCPAIIRPHGGLRSIFSVYKAEPHSSDSPVVKKEAGGQSQISFNRHTSRDNALSKHHMK